ncbi:hypothetical protein Xen7305DRAFT_00016190 [Xenococcus sp. PCC 7305]|uniref:hypothetical protein n=1 Tax=Xenococcus sp. PCC 7305 TaxID=102125 RepID=UPI0002ACB798|nr:hypothetical protein [Xenococcus sp. PCC 7305]ELS01912.1 hypothetical protein Xen7305DRAFT_00016190 [Xenococcus sp. PCC 7305]
MSKCPRCNQSVKLEALVCPYCKNPLKAFGHAGIPLYQATDESFLCDRCFYLEDDSCNYPQRPYAKSCTMFHDKEKPLVEEPISSPARGFISEIKFWLGQHQGLSIILILILISVLLTII